MKPMETKDLSVKFTMAEDGEDKGAFKGYASIFDAVDSYGDIVMRGAFRKTLADKKQFPLLWSHDISKPIGVISAKEDKTGLKVEGQLNLDVQLAREIRSLMKQGAVSGLSIGYQTVKDEPDNDRKARLLREINLWEISPVVFQACPGALIADVKSADTLDCLDADSNAVVVSDKSTDPDECSALQDAEPDVKSTLDVESQVISKPEDLHLLENYRLRRPDND